MKDLVTGIKNGEKDDNNINWEKFRTSNIFQEEDKNTIDCIKLAHKIGDNLGDYEIVHCFKDASYFKDKYSANISSENKVSQNVSENRFSQDVNSEKINLKITVEQDPILHLEKQVVTLVASNSITGKTLDHIFLRLAIEDPGGNIVKNYTGTQGSLSCSFKMSENAVGTFTILTTAIQAGVESNKSLTFQVQ
jgi:hypothetical protein